MSSSTYRTPVSSFATDTGFLQLLPLPALIFNLKNSIVIQSNHFFKFEDNVDLLSLLKKYQFNFFSFTDVNILSHRLKVESKVSTQRIEQIDNQIRTYDIYLSVIPDCSLALLFFNISYKPVTNSQSAFLMEIVQDISEGIGLINDCNILTYCNKSFAELFGLSEKEIIGQNILKVIDRQNIPIIEDEIQNQRALLESTFEIQARTKDESEKFILIHAIPRVDEKGSYVGSVFTTMDITERVIMEHELILNKNKAQESDRLKSTFLANMSHEIRTPMNCIIGFSSMLHKSNLNRKKQEQYLDIIISRGRHLMQILDDIIDITKIEENQIQLNVQPISLYDLFADLKLYVESELNKADNTNVEIIVHHGLVKNEAIVSSDPIRLHQIFTNLLNNAVKFTEKGQIQLGYFMDTSDQLIFYVRDTGIGVDSSMHKIIFERFRQVDESFTRSYGGTGLGLTICQGLVQLLGGKIWVESDGKNGSTFYFTLPNRVTEESVVAKSEVDDVKYNWKGKRILIVEDDQSSYEFLFEALSEYNCEIYYARNAKETHEIILKHDVDLILLDIQLPYVDGLTLTRQIRDISNTVPIIAQTAYAMIDDKQKCIEAGCNEYITKPIQLDALYNIIESYFIKS